MSRAPDRGAPDRGAPDRRAPNADAHRLRPGPRSHGRGSRGVALVEAALILPILVLLFTGMIEAGFAYRDGNVLARATHQAARADSRLADNPIADYEALRGLQSGLSGLTASSLERVIVFDATGGTTTPSASCLAAPRPDDLSPRGVAAQCNIYSPAQVAADDPGAFGCAAGDADVFFCPSTRNRVAPNGDRVGVWVELSYDKVTSVLPGSLKLTRSAVYQLEPCIAGAASC